MSLVPETRRKTKYVCIITNHNITENKNKTYKSTVSEQEESPWSWNKEGQHSWSKGTRSLWKQMSIRRTVRVCRSSEDKVGGLGTIPSMMKSQLQGLSWAVTCFDFLLHKVLLLGPFGQNRFKSRSRNIRQETLWIIEAADDGTLIWVWSGLQWNFYCFSSDELRKGYFRVRNIIRMISEMWTFQVI